MQAADYDGGGMVYDYGYDVAGNLINNNGVTRIYNAVNQLIHDGTNTLTYNANGNLTSDGVNSYAWDRANRMLSVGGVSYQYDGMSNRVQRAVGTDVTQYLLDLQPGLSVVLSETLGLNTTRYIHTPHGIHAQKDSANNWEYMMQDGLGSVRGVLSSALDVLWTGSPTPYGVYFNEVGTQQSPYLFTGEYTDPITGLVHLRARDYSPDLGVFPSLDPLETRNRYAYVSGNPINFVDHTGLFCEAAAMACGVAIGSPFDLFFGDIAACSVAFGCMGAAALGAYLAGQAAANMDVPDLSFSLPNSSQGSGDLSDAERLALAAICGAAVCEADLQTLLATITATLTITWIPVPTAPATATVTMQDHRNFQPTGTPDPRPTQQPIPVRTPDPTATATATPDDPCNHYPYYEAIRCDSPSLYQMGESYVYNSMQDALEEISRRYTIQASNLVLHSRTGQGDPATEGPCRASIVHFSAYVGKHWNVWRNSYEYSLRERPPRGENIPPLAAIKECKCCNSQSTGYPIMSKFAVVHLR